MAHIDLWTASCDSVSDALLADLRACLSEAERAQELRYHFPADRKRYALTRALVRITLSRYAAPEPQDWRFAANAYGRPEIVAAEASAAGLNFNVSHTDGLIVVAVARGRTLGVDVEHLCTRQPSAGLAERYFSPCEAKALAALAPQDQLDRFFEYWTFKEAYIKARGMGLSLPLDRARFSFPAAGAVQLTLDSCLADHAGRWQLWQYRPGPGHLLALCAERATESAAEVSVWRTIPTLNEHRLPLSPTRCSG